MTRCRALRNESEQAATVPFFFPGHCGSVKQDNKRYFILYLQLTSCMAPVQQRSKSRDKIRRFPAPNKD